MFLACLVSRVDSDASLLRDPIQVLRDASEAGRVPSATAGSGPEHSDAPGVGDSVLHVVEGTACVTLKQRGRVRGGPEVLVECWRFDHEVWRFSRC